MKPSVNFSFLEPVLVRVIVRSEYLNTVRVGSGCLERSVESRLRYFDGVCIEYFSNSLRCFSTADSVGCLTNCCVVTLGSSVVILGDACFVGVPNSSLSVSVPTDSIVTVAWTPQLLFLTDNTASSYCV